MNADRENEEISQLIPFTEYIERLATLPSSYIIMISVKDTVGRYYDTSIDQSLKKLGLNADLVNVFRSGYVSIIYQNKVFFEKKEIDKEVYWSDIIEEVQFYTSSRPYSKGNKSELIINKIDYSPNCRGFNIVIFDMITKKVIDSVAFDTQREDILPIRFFWVKNQVNMIESLHFSFDIKKINLLLDMIIGKFNNGKRIIRCVLYYYKNIGDWYALCAAVKNAENELNEDLILLYATERRGKIADWFTSDEYKIKKYRISDEEYNLLQSLSINREIMNRFASKLILWDTDSIHKEYLRHIGSMYGKNLLLPHMSDKDDQYYINLYGIVPQKSFWLMPEANSVGMLPLWFWNFLAEFLKACGFKIFFNVSPKQKKLYKGEILFPPLEDSIQVANLCGNIIALRSGFIDMISSSVAKMLIISPPFYKPVNQIYNMINPERIITVYIDENDPFYEKTSFFRVVNEYFKQNDYGSYLKLQKEMVISLNKDKDQDKIEALLCGKIIGTEVYQPSNNRFIKSNIRYFYKIYYTCYYKDLLVYHFIDIDFEKYRIDLLLIYNGLILERFYNYEDLTFIHTPRQSGEYKINLIVTEKNNYMREKVELKTNFIILQPPSIEKLNECEDFISYLIGLSNYLNDICIFIVSRDTHTKSKRDLYTESLRFLRLLGIKSDMAGTFRSSFLSVIDKGIMITEQLSDNEAILYDYVNEDKKRIHMYSKGFNVNNNPDCKVGISIDEINYAVDFRGLNFVIYNYLNGMVVDSVCFDIYGNLVRRIK